jgi:ABC-type thiamin/hydroxymethylpyrimidine transport system permease subunit
MKRLPSSFAPILFGFFLSGLMSLMVSGIATARAAGLSDLFVYKWLTAWLGSWLVAFPVVLVVAPIVRRLVGKLVEPPGGG